MARMIGITRAKELVLTDEPIPAEKAFRLGLLNRIVPPVELLDEAKAFAKRFQNLPSFAVEMGKKLLDTGMEMGLKKALELERLGFSILDSTKDQQEGLKAFLEKREPRFKGE